MVRSFRHKGLRRLYERDDGSKLAARDVDKLKRILARLDAAAGPSDMDAPGYRLHPLTGNRRGYWSVTVRANWRVIFRFEDGEAADVDLVDYH